ncbi:twin-arginine translocation signal domain-containing protein [Microbacterium natoriense]|uniref:twin-arginine translocation signal domain-containing protein n=1 Tax=Microbacterium natoriense TaxID=284570 RepID=UPI00358EF7AD
MISRRNFLQNSAASAIFAGAAALSPSPPRVVESAYDYTFRLSALAGTHDTSGATLFQSVKPRLAALFPLGGMVNDPSPGNELHLYIRRSYIRVRAAPRTARVLVSSIGSTSFALKPLAGQLGGRGNELTITFADSTLRVRATGPRLVQVTEEWEPWVLWSSFASSIELTTASGLPPSTGTLQPFGHVRLR